MADLGLLKNTLALFVVVPWEKKHASSGISFGNFKESIDPDFWVPENTAVRRHIFHIETNTPQPVRQAKTEISLCIQVIV